MAKKPLITDSTLDALLAKGYISSDFYDSLKPEDDKDKALKKEAKVAEQDFRVAENALPGPANDPFNLGLNGQRPAAPPVASDATSTQPAPPPAAAPKQPIGLTGLSPTLMLAAAGANAGTKVTPQQVAAVQQAEAAQKAGVAPTAQVVGGKPPAPKAPIGPPPPPAQPQALQQRVAAGAYNPYAGPVDQEKFLTPGERARKTQLVEESNLKGDIGNRLFALQAQEDKQVADTMAVKTKEYQAMVDTQAKVRADENRIVQENLDKLTAESKALGQMKIDPTRAWSNLSTGNKILGAIGMFIGAGGTKKGGANPAVQTIEGFIDRDIKAQEFDIKNKSASIGQRAGLLKERMNQFQNLELARQAAKKDALDIAEMQIKTLIAGNKSQKTQLAGEELLANLQEAKNKTMFEFSQANDQRARQLAAQAAARQAAANAKLYEDYKARRDALLKVNEERIKAGLAPLDMEQLAGVKSYDYQASDLSKAKDVRERTVSLPFDPYTGKPLAQPQEFLARDSKDAEEIKKGNAAVQRITRNIEQMQALRAAHSGGGFTLDREGVGKAQALRADTLLAIKEAEKTGALDEGSVDVIGGMIPTDPSSYGWAPDTQLAQTKDIVLQNHQARLQNRLTPGSVQGLPKSPAQLGAKENK